MKKCIFFVFLYLSIVTNLFSSIFSVELSPSAGVMFGRASEYVYLDYKNYQGIQNYNEQLSQLDYDYTVPYISLNVDSKLFSFVHLGATAPMVHTYYFCLFYIPLKSIYFQRKKTI